jgi:hypothetical protein
MYDTITEAVESAIAVIRQGKHYDRNAYVTYWGKLPRNGYNFFFATSDQEAEQRRARVEREECKKYTVVCSVKGSNYDPDAEEEF